MNTQEDKHIVINEFFDTLKKCVKEYERVCRDQRGEDYDLNHYYSPELKLWLRENQDHVRKIFKLFNNCSDSQFKDIFEEYLIKDEVLPYTPSLQLLMWDAIGEEMKKDQKENDLLFIKECERLMTEVDESGVTNATTG